MKQFYIAESGESPHGPYDEAMVKRAYEHGMYPEGTLVWHEEADDWERIENIFGPHIATRPIMPPPPPPVPAPDSSPGSLNQSPGANKKYSLWGRTLRGIGFYIILFTLVGLAVSCGCPKEVILFIYFAGMGVWDAWDTRMKYGISWETASKSSITFWTVAFLIFIIIYISFSPKSLPNGLPMILVLIISVRYHMLKKKYGSPK